MPSGVAGFEMTLTCPKSLSVTALLAPFGHARAVARTGPRRQPRGPRRADAPRRPRPHRPRGRRAVRGRDPRPRLRGHRQRRGPLPRRRPAPARPRHDPQPRPVHRREGTRPRDRRHRPDEPLLVAAGPVREAPARPLDRTRTGRLVGDGPPHPAVGGHRRRPRHHGVLLPRARRRPGREAPALGRTAARDDPPGRPADRQPRQAPRHRPQGRPSADLGADPRPHAHPRHRRRHRPDGGVRARTVRPR